MTVIWEPNLLAAWRAGDVVEARAQAEAALDAYSADEQGWLETENGADG